MLRPPPPANPADGLLTADADIGVTAALIGERSRAVMLLALNGGVPMSAGELARIARIRPSTASVHLKKLVNGRLLIATAEAASDGTVWPESALPRPSRRCRSFLRASGCGHSVTRSSVPPSDLRAPVTITSRAGSASRCSARWWRGRCSSRSGSPPASHVGGARAWERWPWAQKPSTRARAWASISTPFNAPSVSLRLRASIGQRTGRTSGARSVPPCARSSWSAGGSCGDLRRGHFASRTGAAWSFAACLVSFFLPKEDRRRAAS